MAWMCKDVAIMTLNRKVRYKIKLRPKGFKQFLTVDRKELLRFMDDYPDIHYNISNIPEAKVDRTFYIYDYREQV